MKTIDKPWGREIWFANTPLYLGKVLEFDGTGPTSLHYHKKKDETILVLEGFIEGFVWDAKSDGLVELFLVEGESIRFFPGVMHRFGGAKGTRVLEVSTPFPDDVYRVEDDYGREGPGNGFV